LELPTGNSSVGSSISIPRPPLPPPPATERERLVERERQARLETERARRRHLALQRERQLDESGDVVENESSDNVGLLGQVSFDGGFQPAPEFVGDNGLVLELPTGNFSVGSLISIPRPPLPPPLATERERLVERERQARLETERARRRHLALQRERQLDEDNCTDQIYSTSMEARSNYGNGALPETSLDGVLTTLPQTAEGDDNAESNAPSASSVGYRNHAQTEVQNTDAEANSLSYPMERFLERVDDEGPSIVPILVGEAFQHAIDASAADNDAATLPYTMELFLAENAVVGTNSSENERSDECIGESDIHVGQIHQANNDSIEPLVATPAIQPSLDSDTNLIEMPPAPIVWSGGVNDLASSSGSVASIVASTNRGTFDDNEIVQNALADTSFDANPHPLRLTEADIAQLAEVEHASTGNAAPQSVRDEPFLDHAFSVATQTTVIESVTEASEGRGESAFSDIMESEESFNVVRLGFIDDNSRSSSSGAASSVSIEAMPSSDSSDDSDNIIHPPSEGIGDSISHSMAPGSNHFSSQMPLLTEADIVNHAQAEHDIDYASIGNAPPHSVRDERLSESSVTERGGRQFGITTPITEISSVDEHIDLLMVDNFDPSDHSDNSIEAMPSEHGDHDRINDSDEEMIVYQASDMGSSASFEALPSIDLENEIGLHNYGAINAEDVQHNPLAEELTMDIDDCEHDVETAPLISARREERSQPPPGPRNSFHADSCDSREKSTPNDLRACIASLLVLAMAELPTFIIIIQGSEQLCSLLGMKRYQVVLASLVVVTSILNHFGKFVYPVVFFVPVIHIINICLCRFR